MTRHCPPSTAADSPSGGLVGAARRRSPLVACVWRGTLGTSLEGGRLRSWCPREASGGRRDLLWQIEGSPLDGHRHKHQVDTTDIQGTRETSTEWVMDGTGPTRRQKKKHEGRESLNLTSPASADIMAQPRSSWGIMQQISHRNGSRRWTIRWKHSRTKLTRKTPRPKDSLHDT